MRSDSVKAYPTELKDCPFCGNDVQGVLPEFLHTSFGSWIATCGWCGAQGAAHHNRELAAQAWNTRKYAQSEAET